MVDNPDPALCHPQACGAVYHDIIALDIIISYGMIEMVDNPDPYYALDLVKTPPKGGVLF